MEPHVEVVRDTGGLEGLDDVVVVGAAAPDGVGEQVERGDRCRGEHGQVLAAGGGVAVRSTPVSMWLIRATALDCCFMKTPIGCVVGGGGWR
ncbi:hypothetical protein ACPYPE_23525 [Streptomyces griseus]|uniref:hypothetical protein n=1 Tax=Streptomyces griseus TaxID=1911 RepID=UPI003CF591B1